MIKENGSPATKSVMNNSSISVNNNRYYDPKLCATCKTNGCKKRVLHFAYSYSAKICYMCVSGFDTGSDAIKWLEQNAKYKKGLLVGFNKPVKKYNKKGLFIGFEVRK